MKRKLFIQCLYALLFSIFSLTTFAQQKTVTGTILDKETKTPLAGVTVSVRGGAATVATNSEGVFSIVVPSDQSTLEFSYIGYASQQVTVGTQSTISLTMSATDKKLGEVVVVGYGTQRRRDITGSVASLRPEDFNQGVVTNPQQLMQGRAAGVNITASSGKPGGASTIRIRGGTSITAGNDPLYVVDGVPLQLSNATRQSNIGTTAINVFNQEPVNPIKFYKPG